MAGPHGHGSLRPYVCEVCGHEGRYDGSRPVDEVQCPRCGEPVTPMS